MKTCTGCHITKEFIKFGKDSSILGGYRGRCKECRLEIRKKSDYKYNSSHKKQRSLNHKIWRLSNAEKVRKDKRSWLEQNREIFRFSNAKRKAAKLNRTPKWLTKSDWVEIKWAYKIAKEKTKETGIEHQVDHIIPLQAVNISGFHCPQNLQILTKIKNLEKGNRFNDQ